MKKFKPTMSEDKYFTKGTENSFSMNNSVDNISFGEDFYVIDGILVKLAYS